MLKADKRFLEFNNIKDTVERSMYASSGIVSDVVVLTGPDIERHVRNLRHSVCSTKKSKITVVEIDHDVHMKQKYWLESDPSSKKYIAVNKCNKKLYMKLNKNVKAVHSDIINVKPARFIDADLMSTAKTQKNIIESILSKQIQEFNKSQLKKGLIFTFSLRNCTINYTISFLKELLNKKLDTKFELLGKTPLIKHIGKKGLLPQFSQYNINVHSGRVTLFNMYYYCTGNTPMLTGLVVYK